MSHSNDPQHAYPFTLLSPPYDEQVPVSSSWKSDGTPPRGNALVWWVGASSDICSDFRWLQDRPGGVPLFIVLPRPREVRALRDYFDLFVAARPRAVLPDGDLARPPSLARALAKPPADLSSSVTEYLRVRGMVLDAAALDEIGQIFRLAPGSRSLSKLTRQLCLSRRTLGRHFELQGLPVPSHWLQFARLLHVSVHLQYTGRSAAAVAAMFGYPDGFTMSNQMKRLVGCRPSDVKSCLGWEWIVESWVHREGIRGTPFHRS